MLAVADAQKPMKPLDPARANARNVEQPGKPVRYVSTKALQQGCRAGSCNIGDLAGKVAPYPGQTIELDAAIDHAGNLLAQTGDEMRCITICPHTKAVASSDLDHVCDVVECCCDIAVVNLAQDILSAWCSDVARRGLGHHAPTVSRQSHGRSANASLISVFPRHSLS